ncbi:hypothetical protein BCR34DRAFT_138007 [Clohesyomyces aquaticus]|uniref:Mitochondrial phosphate carrier protein n=1 Tax=Clohesyomyces aquaticus TaxID=1231657 RepID=A0A1Y2A0S9_9PLEO|nr:hypothetical protein BCR34DRAFT_138007 [Clohesyomyces aquaticus]
MIITRSFSLTNFFVASSALGFQVFVLYPWHKKLDEGFEELKQEHIRVLDAIRGATLQERRGNPSQLDAIRGPTLQEQRNIPSQLNELRTKGWKGPVGSNARKSRLWLPRGDHTI